jgi:hypothetical protein
MIANRSKGVSFQEDFFAALRAGAKQDELEQIVTRYKAQGLSQQAAYDALWKIWQDLGLQDPDKDSPWRDELEIMMERVWGFTTREGMIWERSLRNQIES